MTVEFRDILYTPIDVPEPPKFDIDNLMRFVNKNKNSEIRSFLSNGFTAENVLKDQYPWDLTAIYFNFLDNGPGWLDGFDKKFPELANYLINIYGLDISDIGNIILLPSSPQHVGYGFWHNDVDVTGLRLYLYIEETEKHKLFLKRSKIDHGMEFQKNSPVWQVPIDHSLFEDHVDECRYPEGKNAFAYYLNNLRSVHVPWVAETNLLRIPVLITPKKTTWQQVHDKTTDLIVKSAEKFKEYAILWGK